MMDESCRVRLWVEQRSDAGFWETERRHFPWQIQKNINMIGWVHPCVASNETFAGVRLTSTAEMEPREMRSSLAWGSDGGASVPPARAGEGAWSVGGPAPPAPAAAAAVAEPPTENGEASGEGTPSAAKAKAKKAPREERILVFLKILGLGKGTSTSDEDGCEGSSSGGDRRDRRDRPVYLTHAMLRGRSPLRSLFELTADLLRDGTVAEDLGAYMEDSPCAWQGAAAEAGRPKVVGSLRRVGLVWRG